MDGSWFQDWRARFSVALTFLVVGFPIAVQQLGPAWSVAIGGSIALIGVGIIIAPWLLERPKRLAWFAVAIFLLAIHPLTLGAILPEQSKPLIVGVAAETVSRNPDRYLELKVERSPDSPGGSFFTIGGRLAMENKSEAVIYISIAAKRVTMVENGRTHNETPDLLSKPGSVMELAPGYVSIARPRFCLCALGVPLEDEDLWRERMNTGQIRVEYEGEIRYGTTEENLSESKLVKYFFQLDTAGPL